jgi:hypothetical protein
VWLFWRDVPTCRPLSVQTLTERDSLRAYYLQNTIDHEVLNGLNRFITYQNLVITNRQPESRTPPITLSKRDPLPAREPAHEEP